MGAGGATPQRLRIAFQPFGGPGWLGGLHYLATLLSALADHAAGEVEAVLFIPSGASREVLATLGPYVRSDPVHLPASTSRAGAAAGLAADGLRRRSRVFESACYEADIDVAFQHAGWLGSGFSIPTLSWLGDFQHRVLPEMFGRRSRWKRELRFQAVLRSASLLYVLSETDRALGAAFYPAFAPKLHALPFAVGVPPEAYACDTAEVRDRYGLPPKFLLFPGQQWRHKNHLAVIEALALLKGDGQEVVVAACGNAVDHRDPGHAPRAARRVADLGLEGQMRMLGVLPRADVWALLRASAAVVNPSLYEGWSTPVEEAKSIGAPLLLSDLPIHREQQPPTAIFFDPRDPADIAAALEHGWRTLAPGPRPEAERTAALELVPRRQSYAQGFVALAQRAASTFISLDR